MYRIYNTYGLPLEISIPYIKEIGGIPDWLDIYQDSVKYGVPWERFKETLGLIITDTYDLDFRKHVISILDKVNELGKKYAK